MIHKSHGTLRPRPIITERLLTVIIYQAARRPSPIKIEDPVSHRFVVTGNAD
jgi:hypothetical protein